MQKVLQKILCVSEKDNCRSLMMAQFLQEYLGGGFLVESAGTRKKNGFYPHEYAIICLWERGKDVTNYETRWIGDLNLYSYSHIICVDEMAAKKVSKFLNGRKDICVIIANEKHGGIHDLSGKGLIAFRNCFNLLENVMYDLKEEITKIHHM